jgi:hypothetical protein
MAVSLNIFYMLILWFHCIYLFSTSIKTQITFTVFVEKKNHFSHDALKLVCVLKYLCHKKRLKFFRAFKAIYASIGASATHVVLTHLLQSFCLPILLYGLEPVSLSKSNLHTLQSTVVCAMFKIFKMKDKADILYSMHCLGVLPVRYAVDLRKWRFLHKEKVHCNAVVEFI